MSGYRCVNFNDLCRLCSNPGNNNTNIFTDDVLQKKISECLPIILNEKDKLPKVICSSCLEYINIFSDFRLSCSKAQKMLESCLNSAKLRNGGQVYIKDEVPVKKVLKPIQNPSPTKLIPNLCNIVSSTPVKQQQQVLKKNIISSPTQDFLSSIIQAVGIQPSDEAPDSNNISFTQNIQPQQATSIQNTPQYTLTLDGNSLKSGQIQYKIENTAIQPQQAQIIVKNAESSAKKNVMIKKVDDPKDKKPKFNLILQTSPQKPKITPLTLSPASKQNLAPKQQIQIQGGTGQAATKQLVVPIMVRNDGQIVSQQIASTPDKSQVKNSNQIAYVQMKIAPNSDGQLTLTAAQPQQHLSLSLSPQQLQQFNIQNQAQPSATSNIQPQFTVTQVTNATQEQNEAQTQTNKIIETHEDDDDYGNDSFEADEDYYIEDIPEPQDKIDDKKTKGVKRKLKHETIDYEEHQELEKEQLELAKTQLDQLVNLNSKKSDSENVEKQSETNTTVCDVCKKTFKKKEFLMQHLKSHIGLRPFKCDEPTCNKSFSRKEHLLRHIVSHTGKKMFTCDVCKKLFSRKDNLNKHRRIHPESGQQSLRHTCPQCNKPFAHKAQLSKHLQNCDGKFGDASEKINKTDKQQKNPVEVVKKIKPKAEKKTEQVIKISNVPQNSTTSAVTTSQSVVQQPQQTQILTFVQPQQIKLKNEHQPQPQQIILSMSQAQALLQQQQQQQKNVYTFPNLILSDGTTFMTTTNNANDVVGNFKFENQ